MNPLRILLSCLSLLALLNPAASAADKAITFERDIEPLLARFGCNAGACHGKARGQNGFALSLLGFDAEFDYAAITKDSHGRRVFPANPEFSLVLRGLGVPVPPSSEEARFRLLERHWSDALDEHDVLSAQADEELLRALQRHVRQNDAFYAALK